MGVQLKNLKDQVIVITGASSGIGLVTAKMAAARGARVVLSARNERDLQAAVDEIAAAGGRAAWIAADVSVTEEVEQIGQFATEEFGGFDTWVNNAGTSIYGRLDEVKMEDKRRLFDVNFWGTVNGCRVAVPHLRERGGAIINIGSVLSDVAIPLQGIYGASKHAVKAYTDTLRMELEEADAPVSVSLIKPAAIDTPFYQHAMNYMDTEPKPAPPVYAPEVVAEAILACAERPIRDVFAGGGGRVFSAMGYHAPRATDRYMEKTQFEGQQDERGMLRDPEGNLYQHFDHDGGERGLYDGHVMQSSLYTSAKLHPAISLGALVGAGLTAWAGYKFLETRRKSTGRRAGVSASDLLYERMESAEREEGTGRGHVSADGWRLPSAERE